ncbi:MAG: prepilin-type N-terminal cleavage/methylation domain-containing protein [Verrucomicrobiota bacterium]
MKLPTARRSKAFTLIEIMVALAILGLIVGAVYSSWMAVVRGAESGKRAAAEVQRTRMALRTLEDALNSTRSFAGSIEYYRFLAENGRNATLSFVAKLPESFPRSGRFGSFDVRRITFSLEPAPERGQQLVMRQCPVLMDMDEDEQQHPVVLLKDVKEFAMAFWDPKAGDWMDEWTQTNQLPAKVLVSLKWGGDKWQSGQKEQQIASVITLPSVMVMPMWQMPGAGPIRPGQQPPLPGNQIIRPGAQ